MLPLPNGRGYIFFENAIANAARASHVRPERPSSRSGESGVEPPHSKANSEAHPDNIRFGYASALGHFSCGVKRVVRDRRFERFPICRERDFFIQNPPARRGPAATT